jgi:hypothetical protein
MDVDSEGMPDSQASREALESITVDYSSLKADQKKVCLVQLFQRL